MTGLLASEGIQIAEKRVRELMQKMAPYQHKAWQMNDVQQLNPHPYTANYFGHTLHIDQNENELVMYGVTHAMVIDGYSRKIISFITIKNCVRYSLTWIGMTSLVYHHHMIILYMYI